MLSTKAILAAAAIWFACSTNAHMILATPIPFGNGLNNSPLDSHGADFPCKLRKDAQGHEVAFDSQGKNNVMPIGVNQTLSFIGSAVHGGGSCQISLTTDKTPTKDSKWQVIHSIEGGCPSNVDGNISPEDSNGHKATAFQYSIPEGIAPNDYILAWTWFNKIGNREMYMNCAPVTVTGGSGKRESDVETSRFTRRATSFPDMFVANIGNGCTTVDSANLKFPNPGDSVQLDNTSPPVPPTGTCATGGDVGSSGGSAGGSSGGAVTPAASAVTPTVSGGVFAGGAAAATSSAPAVSVSPPAAATSSAPAVSVSPLAAASSAPAVAPSTGTTSTAGALTGPCTAEGDWNCIGGNSFQRCASGSWSIVQSLASGTTCTNGQSATLNMGAATVQHKRAIRFSKGHFKRGHSASW
ncbi:MAG: hypothetical protein LQ347_004128 [Umbilicaria vellea]|nr:MAG: hypothetical protein LQ347_004128 [Umbilicaria vellea]